MAVVSESSEGRSYDRVEHMTRRTRRTPGGEPDGAPWPSALAQKSALLHEVDHRVKNNLQLIASLILLQSRRTTDEAARAALKSVLERVTAVATVHRRLFQGDPLRFDVADFVRDLTGDLAAAAGRDDLEIALDLDQVRSRRPPPRRSPWWSTSCWATP